jgi:6-phosphogluconolactonase
MTSKYCMQPHISETREQLALSAATSIAMMTGNAIKTRGYCSLVLSGGETPRRVYQLLGTVPFVNKINWERLHIFFGDERTVPPDDPQSNYGMVRRELLYRLPIPDNNIHRIQGELSAVDAAKKYDEDIEKHFKTRSPRFDIVLLGIGIDGHTASLFPDSDALKEKQKIAIGVYIPQLESWRVTLSLPVINRAAAVLFLISGSGKASIVERILSSRLPSSRMPATLVQLRDGSVEWFLDRAAASLLVLP